MAEVKQWSATTCGPAAVATLLSAYGQPWSPAELERECGLTEHGTTLEGLRAALARRGFRAEGYRAARAAALLRVPRPFIAYVGGAVPQGRYAAGHFLVVLRRTRGGLEVFDPTSGLRKLLSPEHLLERGHGWLLAATR